MQVAGSNLSSFKAARQTRSLGGAVGDSGMSAWEIWMNSSEGHRPKKDARSWTDTSPPPSKLNHMREGKLRSRRSVLKFCNVRPVSFGSWPPKMGGSFISSSMRLGVLTIKRYSNSGAGFVNCFNTGSR